MGFARLSLGQVRAFWLYVPLFNKVEEGQLMPHVLNSSLGRYDGRVYEDLFYRAHVLNPLNKLTFNPNYHNNEIVMGSGDAGQILAKL